MEVEYAIKQNQVVPDDNTLTVENTSGPTEAAATDGYIRGHASNFDAGTSQQRTATRKRPNDQLSSEEHRTKRMANDASVANGSNFEINEMEVLHLIVDLATEMLEAILRNVTSRDLLNCRQVNRKWNEISSEIMRQRADIEIKFSFEYAEQEFVEWIVDRATMDDTLLAEFIPPYNRRYSKPLSNLVACVDESKHFPFTCFQFDKMSRFEHDDMVRFLSIWGRNILALGVTLDDPEKNEQTLRTLLLEKVPNLKKLELTFERDSKLKSEIGSSVRLFADSKEYELPKLEVLLVNSGFKYFRGIVADILKAASNLNCFEICSLDKKHAAPEEFCAELITAKDLTMLQTLNKLYCLKTARLFITEDDIIQLDKAPINFDLLQMQSLDVTIGLFHPDNQQFQSRAVRMISKIFDSCKSTLHTIGIAGLGLLSESDIPKFENLRKLTLSSDISFNGVSSFFPPLLDFGSNFPNLQELTVFLDDDDYFEPYQPLTTMPKVELLQLVGREADNFSEKLMQMTPNVKTLLVRTYDVNKLFINFRAISNNLPKLENLGWLICGTPDKEFQNKLDSALTGFSESFCKKMAAEFRSKECLSAQKAEAYGLHRQHFSILDLKNLKRFDIDLDFFDPGCETSDSDCECSRHIRSDDEAGFDWYSPFYKTRISKVTKFLAFDQMPNLTTNTTNRSLNSYKY